jgi:hypothetical protein
MTCDDIRALKDLPASSLTVATVAAAAAHLTKQPIDTAILVRTIKAQAREIERLRAVLDLIPEIPMPSHPRIITTPDKDEFGDDILKCPRCGRTGSLQEFDCLGADPGCVFCNGCNEELSL